MTTVRTFITEWGIKIDSAKLDAFDKQLDSLIKKADQAGVRLNRLGAEAVLVGQKVVPNLTPPNSAIDKIDRIGRELEKAKRKSEDLGRSLQKLGNGIKSVGTKLTLGLTLPLTIFGGVAFKNAAKIDAMRRALTTLSGSEEAADAQLRQLKETAKLPGLGFEEAVRGALRLQGAGFSADRARITLEAFANAIAATGGGRRELDGVTRALSQISAKGKVLFQEINQIAERLPQIRVLMKQAFGTANSEDIAKLGLTAEQFIDGIVVELLKIPKVTGGPLNAMENIADSAFRASAAFGRIIEPVVLPFMEKLADVMERAADFMDTLTPATRKVITVFLLTLAAIGPVVFFIGQLIASAGGLLILTTVLQGMGIAWAASGTAAAAAIGTMLLIPLAIIAIGAAIGLLIDDIVNFAAGNDSVFGRMLAWFDDISVAAVEMAAEVGDAIGVMTDALLGAFAAILDLPGVVLSTLAQIPSALIEAAPRALGTAGGTTNNNNSANSVTVAVNVPPGTSPEDAGVIGNIVSKTVREEMGIMLRQAQSATGG